jgi:hypothetical protein
VFDHVFFFPSIRVESPLCSYSFYILGKASFMRPICGAIIAAGALIGLGLFALGFGIRHAGSPELSTIDALLVLVLGLLVAALFVGVRAAFRGLAHHQKQHLEMVREHIHTDQTIGTVHRVHA